jgi:hypothetical protein
VKTIFNQNGKDIARAEAAGNAELFVRAAASFRRKLPNDVNAARFDCEFFPIGNNAKNCAASGKTKSVRVPTAPAENRGTQTLIADNLNAAFNQQTQDVQQLDAAGNTKFSELDRNGIAGQINFSAADGIVVRLRGGEPTVWDSRARAKANEIDWDTRGEKTFLRGNASTTYYSQKQTGGATPFGETDKPVFVTAASAEFDHSAETGVYAGNARAWQENNYVRADRLFLRQKQGQLVADGTVKAFYIMPNARKAAGKRTFRFSRRRRK